jgi:hypothetical protein
VLDYIAKNINKLAAGVVVLYGPTKQKIGVFGHSQAFQGNVNVFILCMKVRVLTYYAR